VSRGTGESPDASGELDILMISFENYLASVKFVCDMHSFVLQLRPDMRVVSVKVASSSALKDCLSVAADLVIVSGHGPAYTPRKPFVPAVGDLAGVRLAVSEFGAVGARAGMFWDACNTGRPGFQKALAPCLSHPITHVGVIGKIREYESWPIARKFLAALLSPPDAAITPDAVAKAARTVRAATGRAISSATLG